MQPKVRARVTFYYDAAEPDELSLKEGDIVEILSQDEEGWWEGLCNGKKGVFPANFVEVIKESASKEMPVPPGTPVKEQKDIEREELISFDEKSDKILGSEVELKPSTAEEGMLSSHKYLILSYKIQLLHRFLQTSLNLNNRN